MGRAWLLRLRGLGSVVPFDFCSWCSRTWCCDCDTCWSWWSSCCPLLCLACLGFQRCQVDSRSRRRHRRSSSSGTDGRLKKRHRRRSPSPVLSSRRREKHYQSSSVFRGYGRFSSSLFWSLLRWRRLTVVLPASAVDCCLSGLQAGVCSLL